MSAIESARNAGLTDGTSHSDAYISGYEAGVADTIASDKLTSDSRLQMYVDRFLAWPVPTSCRPDNLDADGRMRPSGSGTNLLTADEARQMLEYVLGLKN